MWSSLSSGADEWEAALEAEKGAYDNSVVTASANAICAARRFNEIFIGGDETPSLVQLLCAPQDESAVGGVLDNGEADILASVLLPTDEVEIAFTTRGPDAMKLVAGREDGVDTAFPASTLQRATRT